MMDCRYSRIDCIKCSNWCQKKLMFSDLGKKLSVPRFVAVGISRHPNLPSMLTISVCSSLEKWVLLRELCSLLPVVRLDKTRHVMYATP